MRTLNSFVLLVKNKKVYGFHLDMWLFNSEVFFEDINPYFDLMGEKRLKKRNGKENTFKLKHILHNLRKAKIFV